MARETSHRRSSEGLGFHRSVFRHAEKATEFTMHNASEKEVP